MNNQPELQNSFLDLMTIDDDGIPNANLPEHEEFLRMSLIDSGVNAQRIVDHTLSLPYLGLFNDEFNKYDDGHLPSPVDCGQYTPPEPALVKSVFKIVKKELEITDQDLAELLLLSSARSIRGYRCGDNKVPRHVWHRFLIITGYTEQEFIPVIGRF